MFCAHCGKALDDDSRFCVACGHPVAEGVVTAVATAPPPPPKGSASNTPVLVLYPRFVGAMAAGLGLSAGFAFALFVGISGSMAASILSGIFSLALPSGTVLACAVAAFLLAMPVVMVNRKRAYDRTEYRFFADHLEYYEGFWAREQKMLSYRNVTEVVLRKGVLQQQHGLGTVFLATAATGGSGVSIADIEDPDKVYEMVKELVAKSRDGRR